MGNTRAATPLILILRLILNLILKWCDGRDLNPQALRHMHLKHACMPFHHRRTSIKTYFFGASGAFGASAAFVGSAAGVAAAAAGVGETLGVAPELAAASAEITLRVFSSSLERVNKKLVNKNKIAQTDVVFVKKLPAPLLPKIVWLELPPNTAPPSALPGCKRITKIKNAQIQI